MGNCPICHLPMKTEYLPNDPQRLSRDHILPRSMGGRKLIHGNVRNIRIMCAQCNWELASCAQCIGALFCARAVAESTNTTVERVLHKWRFRAEIRALWKEHVRKKASAAIFGDTPSVLVKEQRQIEAPWRDHIRKQAADSA